MQSIRDMFLSGTKEMAFLWLSNPQLTEFFLFLAFYRGMVSTRKAKYFAWSDDGDFGHQFEALDRVPSSSFCRKPTWEKQRRESVTGKDFFLSFR